MCLETSGIWTMDGPGDSATVRILVSATNTEAVTDQLTQRYGTREGFRILLLPVEATFPKPEEPVKPMPLTNRVNCFQKAGL